jgi:hypothetical protein
MNDHEKAALKAWKVYAQRVRVYNALIAAPDLDYSSQAYIEAANDMEAANDAVLAAAECLLTTGGDT